MNRIISKLSILTSLFLSAAMLQGCAPSQGLSPQSMISCDHKALRDNGISGPALVSAAYGSVTDVPLDAVTVHDARLYRSVVTQSLYAEQTATGTTQVTARFVNCTDRQIQMRARINFFDSVQAPVENVSSWKTLFLPPRSITAYQERSFSDRGVDSYVIEIAPAG